MSRVGLARTVYLHCIWPYVYSHREITPGILGREITPGVLGREITPGILGREITPALNIVYTPYIHMYVWFWPTLVISEVRRKACFCAWRRAQKYFIAGGQ